MSRDSLSITSRGIKIGLATLLVATLAVTAVPGPRPDVALANGSISLNEPFTGANLSNPLDWISMRGTGATSTNEWPCLTAAEVAISTAAGTLEPGKVEACINQGANATDSAGSGALRLTRRHPSSATANPLSAAGSLLYVPALSSAEGIDISFSIRMEANQAADGISFFLKDGANAANTVGQAGGALGYGLTNGLGNGVPGAMLGIGFDTYGSFSTQGPASADCGGVNDRGPGPTPTLQTARSSLVLRGPDTSGAQDGSRGYCYLDGADVTYSGSAFQRVRVTVAPYDHTANLPTTVSAYLAPHTAPTVLPSTPTLTGSIVLTAPTFRFGFSASTGYWSNNHDLQGLVIRPAGAELASLGTSAATGSGTGPTSGGTLLTITGTGIDASASATVGGQACTDVVVSGGGTQMTCLTPAGSPGIAQVVVTNPNGGPGYGTFTYVNPTPTVSAVNPASGTPDGGNTVTITGNDFILGATATLGGQTCANPVVTSATTLTCVAPAGTDGAVVDAVVTNLGGASGTGASLYTYSTVAAQPAPGQQPPAQPATPPADPTPSTPAPRAPVTVPRAPIPANVTTGALPELTPGNSMVTEEGRPREVEVVIEDRTDLVMRGQDFELRLRGECAEGCEVTTDATGRETIALETDGAARVSGEGFLPGTPVYVWLFSEPTFLGEFTVAADGTFTGRVPLTDIAAGTHTLQVNGTSFDGVLRSANLGVVVTEPTAPAPVSATLPQTGTAHSAAMLWALLALCLGALMLLSRRGRLQNRTIA